MSGFHFPPPPPPPPKPSIQTDGGFNSGGRGRGRGKGRGESNGRGRGGPDSRGRGGRGGSHVPNSWDSQYGNNHRQFNSNSNGQHAPGPSLSSPYGSLPNLPPGSFVNPAFHPPAVASYGAPIPSPFQRDNNANGYPCADSQINDSHGSAHTAPPLRTAAGHKRKLDALRGPSQDKKKSGPSTAPSVPGFGSPILPQRPPPQTAESEGRTKKRTSNVLGLNPGNQDPQYSSDSDNNDDDADEEAMFAELGTNLTFEHEGQVLSLNTLAELAAWKHERSKNFPTKDRLAAKMEERRRNGEERMRLLVEASSALQHRKQSETAGRRQHSNGPSSESSANRVDSNVPETELEKAKRHLAEQTANLAALRKKVSASEARRAHASRNLYPSGLSMINSQPEISAEAAEGQVEHDAAAPGTSRDATTSKALETEPGVEQESLESQVSEEKMQVVTPTSSPSTSSAESSSDEDSGDDGPPEEITSKVPKADEETKQQVCRYFTASGYCRHGDACVFKHKPQSRAPGTATSHARREPTQQHRYPSNLNTGRKGIHDLLVQQEQEQENQMALKVIKHLGKMDFFAASRPPDE